MSMTDILSSPTYRATRGRVPVFRPLLKGEEFDILIKEALVGSGEFNHDVVVLSCSSSTLTTTDGMLDSPISFYWGQSPRTELFCGYIIGVSEDQAGKGNLTFTLQVLGATQPMQTGRPRFWRNRSMPSAVEALSYAHGLGFHGHPHTHLWPSLAQTNESDWQSAVSLTKRIGWSLFNRYGVLLCYDPNVLITDLGPYARLVSVEVQDNNNYSEDRRLIEFTPSERSDEIPENMGAKVAYFTDKGTVQVTKEIGEFKSYRFATNAVIRNAEEATLYANAGASRMDDWKQHAEARIWGDADLLPGMTVDVHTANRAYYRQKYDGRWLIQSVQHKMDVQQFQTNLRLARPGSDTPITQAAYTSFWTQDSKARPTLSLQDGMWVSSWTDPRLRDVL